MEKRAKPSVVNRYELEQKLTHKWKAGISQKEAQCRPKARLSFHYCTVARHKSTHYQNPSTMPQYTRTNQNSLFI
jgi:hypothetical protein